MNCQRLALGTAQLGSDYGIAHTSKKITRQGFKAIMCAARDAGVYSIDTAMAYGDSHRVLGKIGVNEWAITTKLPPVPDDVVSIDEWYEGAIASSLADLKVSTLNTLLIHDIRELSGRFGSALINLMLASKSKGDLLKVGVSIYAPDELEVIFDKFRPDVVQCPYNIFDQRMRTSGWLQKLNSEGVEVQARSVFLQGIILRKLEELNPYFKPWYENFAIWEDFCGKQKVSKLDAAMAFVKAEKLISKIIVGVESRRQLEEVLVAYSSDVSEIFTKPCEDVELVNPLMWQIT